MKGVNYKQIEGLTQKLNEIQTNIDNVSVYTLTTNIKKENNTQYSLDELLNKINNDIDDIKKQLALL